MEKRKRKLNLKAVAAGVLAVLFVAAVIGTAVANYYAVSLNTYFGTSNYKINNGGDQDNTYFQTAYEDEGELAAHEEEISKQVEAEGAVLLKNDNAALPLASGSQVSLFSHSVVDPVYGGTGSGSVEVTEDTPTLRSTLKARNMGVNGALWDFYKSGNGSGDQYARSNPEMQGNGGTFSINEVPWSVISAESGLEDSFTAYGDAAIVMFSRVGGEGYDLAANEDSDTSVTDEGVTNYLQLNSTETEMLEQLKALKDQGTFKKIIVLINSSNALELDFLNPEACGEDYGIDAALWIGGPGQCGLDSVAAILAGEVNPSGRLVDTWANDNLTAPTVGNFGQLTYWENADGYELNERQDHYAVYVEGIYVGYRYYETRYEDTVMGTGNTSGYNYTADVAYPFGYGLSYTDFAWSNYSVKENADSFDVSVTVTNTGAVTGKDVVEAYFQSPYTDYDRENKIEKASIELAGFGKTETLAPGASETVTINIPKEELRTYDANKAKTYILDAGDYYFAVGRNAHDALNNVLAAKGYSEADGMTAAGNADMTFAWNNPALDTTTYAVSAVTGNEITNQYEETDANNYFGEGTVTYLSRSDWQGTWPTGTVELAMSDKLYTDLDVVLDDKSADYEMPTFGADGNLTLANMSGKDYDDPEWEQLLDQMSFDEMSKLVGWAAHQTQAVPSIAKPATKDENGPTGLNQTFFGGKIKGMAYPSAVVIASTWNTDLMETVGECMGEDGLHTGVTGLYGPATNIHRSAYMGRNFEYYSENPFLSGKSCAAVVRGVQSKGVITYVKHFALNEQGTGQSSLSTWSNEQAIREIYLEPFEKAVEEGGTKALMLSFNRYGAKWSGSDSNTNINVLRNEWGFDGFTLTDNDSQKPYMSVTIALPGGTNGYDCWSSFRADQLKEYRNNAELMSQMRESAHRILYVIAGSAAMNGISENATVTHVYTWWQIACVALDVVLGIGCAAMIVWCVRDRKKAKANTAPAADQQ